MTKRLPSKGQGPFFNPGFNPGSNPGSNPQGAPRATVGLPPSAGGTRPSVSLPGANAGAPGMPRRLTEAEITRILQLGGTHLAAGRLDHAGKAAGAVLQVEPKNPDALHLLGLVALGKGDLAVAEKLIAAAAAMLPRHVNVWVNLGNAQRDQGKEDEALSAYLRAEAINPDYPDIFLNRGQLYKDTSRFMEAMEEFERLIEINPDQAAPYMRAASAATDAGLFKEAVAFCESALERVANPPPQVKSILATTHERLGSLDKAIEIAEEVLASHPMNAGAFRTWSKARRRKNKNDPALLKELAERLEKVTQETLAPADARLLFSELAQVYDELGETDAAFDYFTRMNERTSSLPELKNLDRTKFLNEVDELQRLFTRKNVAKMSALPAIGKEPGHADVPVFLVGFPRSGTTLLDQILDAHPQVQVFEELPLLNKVRKASPDYPRSLSRMTEAERIRLRAIYWSVLREAGADLEGKTVVNKMPLDMVHAGLIARVFPEAKIVLALRHPADCVLSCFMQDFVPNGGMVNFLTLQGSAVFYDRVFKLWQSYREVMSLHVQEVRYENLVADLRAEVEPALDFLGLDWNEAMSDPAAHALARGTIRTPSYSQVTQPIYSTSAERWRRYEEQMRPVLSLLAPHVERLGYKL